MIYIFKFLAILIYPLGIVLILGILSIVMLASNKRKIGYLSIFLSFSILIFFSSPIVSHKLMRTLECRYSPSYKYPPVSAIVLLGGAEVPKLPPRIYNETNQNADRIMNAARLFKKKHAPYLITTGGKISFLKDFYGSEADISSSLLTELFGVDSRKILIEPESKNTYENAVNVKKLLEKYNLKPAIILVTSAYHMHRSVAVFNKQGFTVYPAPTDYYQDENFQFKFYMFFPDSGALGMSTLVLHEYYGMLGYKLL